MWPGAVAHGADQLAAEVKGGQGLVKQIFSLRHVDQSSHSLSGYSPPAVFSAMAATTHGLILLIGDAVPLVRAAQDLDAGLALLEELRHDAGQEVLGLERVGLDGIVQELREAGLGLLQEAVGEAPEVHGDYRAARDLGPGLAVVLGVARVGAHLLDVGVLRDLEEVVVLVLLADAAGDVSVLGDGVAQEVADHGELIAVVAVRVALEVLVYLPEALGAVVVVGVDYGEGAVNYVAGGEDGVAGAPWLDAAVGDGIAGRQVVELLVGVLDVYELGEPVAYGLVESLPRSRA